MENYRLINAYNDILDINRNVSDSSVNVFYNDCPHMLEPLKKITVTKILQVSILQCLWKIFFDTASNINTTAHKIVR